MSIHLASIDDVPRLVQAFSDADRLCVDTEFHAERRYQPALYLIQIALPDGETWILDPLIDGLVAHLAEPLRSVPWIVHGGHWDMSVLQVALGGLPEVVLDTQIAAGLISPWWPAPYTALMRQYQGREVDKTATLSDWSRRPLTAEQLAYAAADVEPLGQLWDHLAARLEALDRTHVAQQACAEARSRVVDPPSPDEAWRQLAAHAALEPQQLAVLQEIAAWRQERAISMNQPERAVLSDGSVVELARRQPRTRGDLLSNRRVPRSLQKNADELLERIGRASHRPEWAWPRGLRRRTPEWRTVAFLEVWAQAIGVRDQLAAGLVLPRSVLEDAVLNGPGALSGWRRELVGDDLDAVLSGHQTLRLSDGDLALGTTAPGGPPAPPEG